MKRLKQFIWNGILITAVSFFMRAVSVSFNVYISNKIGAVAVGLFTLISTVYGFSVTLATSGIGLATTKMVAEAMGEERISSKKVNQTPTVMCIVRKCSLYALSFSVATAVFLFVSSPWIGKNLLLDERTVLPLRILAVTLPPIALSSVLSGYFTAVRRVYKNAVVQILGQAVKIFACIGLLSVFCADDVESACLAIVLGGSVAELLSFLIQFFLYFGERKSAHHFNQCPCNERKIQKKLLHIALPVAFSAYVRSGLVTWEHMLIPWGLERSGSGRDLSLAAYGMIHSMVFPLVLFPSALTGAFAGLLVPEIAESQAQGDTARMNRITEKVLEAVLIFAIGTAGILMCFSYDLSGVIYPKANVGAYILMIAPLVPLMYLDTSVDALLKGMGEQFYCMIVNIIDSLLSVILVWLLLPKLGILGYIFTVYFTETLNATLSIVRLLHLRSVKTRLLRWVVQPLFCIVLSTVAIRHFLSFQGIWIQSAGSLIFQIGMTALMYGILLTILRKPRFRTEKFGRRS